MHSERERQFYLGVAGVQLWYARSALPGAAPSPDFLFDDEQDSEAEQFDAAVPAVPAPRGSGGASSSSGRQETSVARVADLQKLMEGGESPASPPDLVDAPASDKALAGGGATASEEEVQVPVSGELTPELNLQLWVGRDVALIAGLSAEASLSLQETLAENILKSLGETRHRKVGPVRWPVFNNLRAPGNSMAELRAVLGHVLSALKGRKVVVLGLVGPEGYDGDESWLQYISGIRPELNFSGTLAELSTNPSQKRALWQQLKSMAGQ